MLGLLRLGFVVGFAILVVRYPADVGSVLVWTVVGFAAVVAISVAFGRGS